jgi:hypothetical protein
MYCCIWCHTELKEDETFINSRGSTSCKDCRGLGIVVNKWRQPCRRKHKVPIDVREAAKVMVNMFPSGGE